MKRRILAAALLLPFVSAVPARGQADDRSANRVIGGPTYMPVREARTPYLPLAQRGPTVSVSSSPFIQRDGSAVYRKSLIGSLPVARDVNIGLGLIEVTRTSPKEKSLQRMQPITDTLGRSDRIAAIGLSVSF